MIRVLDEAELPRILPLVRQVQALHAAHLPARFHTRATDAAFLEWYQTGLRDNDAFVLVDERDGQLAGYLLAIPQRQPRSPFNEPLAELMLDQICVDARFRRQGVGTSLIVAMEARMQELELTVWRAKHWVFNAASAALMQKMGADLQVLVRGKAISPSR